MGQREDSRQKFKNRNSGRMRQSEDREEHIKETAQKEREGCRGDGGRLETARSIDTCM